MGGKWRTIAIIRRRRRRKNVVGMLYKSKGKGDRNRVQREGQRIKGHSMRRAWRRKGM